jgi:hypothetical protein
MNIENDLKTLSFDAPKWVQLELQAFWYGLLSWLLTCAEDCIEPTIEEINIKELLVHADQEFDNYPSGWLLPTAKEVVSLKYNYEQLQDLFEKVEKIFQETVPIDINIFTILSNGEVITLDQWERLNEAIAFTSPSVEIKRNNKTKRIHGRRAITPIKGRKVFTRNRKLIVNKE